jgi:C4-type Zn-finger protein
MPKLTKSQIKKYLDDPIKCPLCGSSEIEAMGQSRKTAAIITDDIQCYDCGYLWTDVYTLTGIEVEDE